jgi:hypothetical protein
VDQAFQVLGHTTEDPGGKNFLALTPPPNLLDQLSSFLL